MGYIQYRKLTTIMLIGTPWLFLQHWRPTNTINKIFPVQVTRQKDCLQLVLRYSQKLGSVWVDL